MINDKISKFILLIWSVILLGMVALKAHLSSFTHDESFSYLNYVPDRFSDILSFSNSYTNNHILNSMGMKFSEIIFGTSEFTLRLPNILALVLFLFFAFKILFHRVGSLIAVFGFVLISSVSSLNELFGLARGYGLSFAFLLGSLFFLISYFEKKGRLSIVGFHAMLILGVLSNFNIMTVYIALLIVWFILVVIEKIIIRDNEESIWRDLKFHIFPMVVAIAFLFEPIRRVLTYADLGFGGKSGFVADTVTQVSLSLFAGIHVSPWGVNLTKTLVLVSVLISLILWIKGLMHHGLKFFRENIALMILNLSLIIISLIIISTHHILGSDYPVARFCLFLVPLVILHFLFFIDYIHKHTHFNWILGLVVALAFANLYVFLSTFNTKTYREWAFDQNTKQMVKDLKVYHAHCCPENANLQVHWLFEPSANFYQQTEATEWLNPVLRDPVFKSDEYLYLFKAVSYTHLTLPTIYSV